MPKQECGEYGKPGKQNRPLSVCCSKFGFCGSTSEFCDAGCQQRFGECGDVERPSCSKDGGSISQQSIGYYESWANTRACSNVAPEDLNLDGLTHVNFAFVFFNPGTFSRQPEDLSKEIQEAFGSKYGYSHTYPTSYWYLQHIDVAKHQPYVDWPNLMFHDPHGKNPHCNKPNGVCEFSDGGKKGRCSKASGILTLQEIKETIKEKSLTQWVSYDDADTFQKKKEFANSRCLAAGGTMVWALDQVDQSSKSLLYAKEWTEKEIAAAEDTVRDESVKGVCYTTTKCGGKCRKGDHEAAQMSGQPGLHHHGQVPVAWLSRARAQCTGGCADFKTELTQNTNHDSDKSDQTCTGVTQSYCCAGFQPPITKEQIKEKVKDKAADAIEAAETLALEVAARAFCRIDITAAMKPLTFIPAVGECLT
uniref:chitinase n=1 Tax=Ophiocordyceps sinensis TaxID=72228 RepID=A0A097F8N8_9HYPO|nr:glycoside hydrolase family 18 [Ophiocordyceps sinensis]